MSLNALLFSKSPATAQLPAAAVEDLGIRIDVCSDIFSAIKKGTQQSFSCLIVDWADRPEVGFLLKRARESAANRNTVAIAIVDHVPSPVEAHENQLDFFIHRPIAAEEVREVLAKACRQMKGQMQAALDAELVGPLERVETRQASNEPENPNSVPGAEAPASPPDEPQMDFEDLEREEETAPADEPLFEEAKHRRSRPVIGFRMLCAAVLTLVAAFCIWRSRDTVLYLAHTHEGIFQVARESMAALVSSRRPGAQPAHIQIAEEQQDAYFSRTPQNTNARPTLALIPVEADLPEGSQRLRKAFNFPLPTPELMRSDPPPLHVRHPQVPESLRGAPPITRPVVAPSGSGPIVPVSITLPQIPQFTEAAHLSEEAARGLLIRSVDPVYPPEAAAQNLEGPVVLQALIGRDGRVEDLKIVRGYFVLGRAAIAAVQKWQFQPYMLNGHAAKAQTLLTVNFTRGSN
jgi:TonB family protein